MKKIAIATLVWLGTWINVYSDTSSALKTAFESKRFNCDAFAISSNAKYLCYSLIDQNANKDDNNQDTYFPGETPFPFIGSRLYIHDLGENKGNQIGPPGNCWLPSWSPDNKKIAFYSDEGKRESHVWIYEVDSGKFYPIVSNKVHAILHHSLRWDKHSQHLYVFLVPDTDSYPGLASQNTSLATMDLSTETTNNNKTDLSLQIFQNHLKCILAKVDVQTGKISTLIPFETSKSPLSIKLSASGQSLAYLSLSNTKLKATLKYNYDLTLLNMKDDSLIDIDENLTSSLYRDNCYEWHPKQDLLVYLKEGHLFSFRPSENGSNVKTELFPHQEDRFVGKPFFFSDNGKWLIVGVNPSFKQYSDRPSSLQMISFDTLDIKNISWDSEKIFLDAVWNPQQNALIVKLMSNSGETELIKHSISDNQTETTWKGNASLRYLSYHQDTLFAQIENLNTPANICRWNLENRTWERITHINPQLDHIQTPNIKQFNVEIPTSNGQLRKVTTTVLLPKSIQMGDKVPGIVFFYPGENMSSKSREFCGGGGIGTIPNYLLLEKGYAIILPDCPLDFLNGPSHPVDAIVDALLPQVYEVCHQGLVDIHKLGILGHSYGGYATAAVISRTHLFRAAIALSGVYDLAGSYGYIDDEHSFFGLYWSEYSQGGMGSHPWQEFLRFVDNSPYYLADNITTPLLLIHGKNDFTCFVQEAQKMFTALMRLNKSARLLIYSGGHRMCDWPKEEAIDASQHILEYFDTYLKQESL